MSDVKNETPEPTDEQPAVQDTPQAEPTPEERLAAAEAEIGSLRDQLLRALAETENVRRRAAREREDASKFAVTAFARDMLSVADNLRRALEAVAPEALDRDEALKALVTGVEMTERQLFAAFEKHGIRRIDALGQKFDSNLHQAMFEVPGSGQPAGTVVEQMQAGYLLNDRLLRPAMVGVAKGDPQPAKADPQPAEATEAGGQVDTTV